MKSRLYTRTGDQGTTSLVGGTRAAKDSPRLEAYGTIDELNSWLGLLAASTAISDERRADLRKIQNRLFDIGAALATEPESAWQPQLPGDEAIEAIEALIDRIDSRLPRLRAFILPGGHPDAARANIARTVARRAERRIVSLAAEAHVDTFILRYVNRLSDLLFAIGREINLDSDTPEETWNSEP